MRVFELAKQLGLPSKELINDLKTMGVTVANHMAALEENVVTQVQHKFESGKKDPGKSSPAVLAKKKPVAARAHPAAKVAPGVDAPKIEKKLILVKRRHERAAAWPGSAPVEA